MSPLVCPRSSQLPSLWCWGQRDLCLTVAPETIFCLLIDLLLSVFLQAIWHSTLLPELSFRKAINWILPRCSETSLTPFCVQNKFQSFVGLSRPLTIGPAPSKLAIFHTHMSDYFSDGYRCCRDEENINSFQSFTELLLILFMYFSINGDYKKSTAIIMWSCNFLMLKSDSHILNIGSDLGLYVLSFLPTFSTH